MEIPTWLFYFLVFVLPVLIAMGLASAWYVSQPKKAISKEKIDWKRMPLAIMFALIILVAYGYFAGWGCSTGNQNVLQGVRIFEYIIYAGQWIMYSLGYLILPSSLANPPTFSNCR